MKNFLFLLVTVTILQSTNCFCMFSIFNIFNKNKNKQELNKIINKTNLPKIIQLPDEWKRETIPTDNEMLESCYLIPDTTEKTNINALLLTIHQEKNTTNSEDLEEYFEEPEIEFEGDTEGLSLRFIRYLVNQNPEMIKTQENNNKFLVECPLENKNIIKKLSKPKYQKVKNLKKPLNKRKRNHRRKKITIKIEKTNKPTYLQMLNRGLKKESN